MSTMGEYLSKFFDTSDFPARWYCGNWSEFLGWLHILSDIATFGAYFAIPLVLFYFARKRDDFPFSKLFWLFGGFILACGTVHLIEAIIFWHPIYRVSGMLKFTTAIVSWVTVIVLVRYTPRILHLPSMAATNAQLKQEIRQREQSERELRAAKDRHDAILTGTRSIVWTTSPEGGFLTPQISWERYTGQSWDQHKDFGWTKAIHEDDLPDVQRRWQDSISTGTKHQATGRIWHQESQSYRAFVAEAVPVKNDDGTIREWVGTVSDTEEQQQAEKALGVAHANLIKQKRELELIYEAAPVGLSLLDRNYRYLRVNETLARINGYSKEQHIGKRVDEILPELRDQLCPLYDEVFATGNPKLNVEIVGRTPASEETRTWFASFFPLGGDNGVSPTSEVAAVNAIVQDITERKRTEQRLKKSEATAMAANQAKGEFLANMSHEIRTPMAAILGYADVLLGHLKDPDNRNCVLVMKRNGQHLLELINDILDLSRIEAGKLEIDVQSVSLVQLVDDVQALMQVRADAKNLMFHAEFSSTVPETIGTDPTRLRQVLINLIGNAIKFTEEGSVVLSVGLRDKNVLAFSVRDTGIGMSDTQRERLFKPFSQGDSSVTRSYGGSGLGLAISNRLAAMLGGEISLESEPGVGSTFTLTFPFEPIDDSQLVQPDLTIRIRDVAELNAKPPKLDCRVLVVDDRRDVRHISQHFLEKAGATVSTAEDGQQGIDTALAARDAGEPFDLVVMDMQMPNVDGLQAVAGLRSAGIEWPIIALTADAMKGDRDKCLNGGCDDYLSKPIDQAKLIGIAAKYTQSISLNELRRSRTERAQAFKATLNDPANEN
jgi:signal transduction histidine kinase/FixJ family two-component response regulator